MLEPLAESEGIDFVAAETGARQTGSKARKFFIAVISGLDELIDEVVHEILDEDERN